MKIISNLAQRKSGNCYSGNVCYLLERNGILLSEHVSFGLGAGLNFVLEVNSGLSFRAVRELHCLTEFIQSLGVRVAENTVLTAEALLQLVRSHIDNDMPVMVDYDGYYCVFTQIFNKKHERRRGLIVGYGDEEICFSDFIYSAYGVTITREMFLKAIDPALGACVLPTWYDVSFPEDINQKITPELVRDSLTRVSDYFLAQHGSHTAHMVGIEGMKLFAWEIENLILKQQERVIKVDWTEFSEDLKQMVITLTHYGNFLLEILSWRLPCLDSEGIQRAAELFHEAGNQWRILCGLFFKLGMTGKESIKVKLKQKVMESSELLEEAFKIIQTSIKNDEK